MKLSNQKIWDINLTIGKLSLVEVDGKLAFKLYKIKKKLEEEAIVINKALEGKEEDSKEVDSVMNLVNDVDISKISSSELRELKLSIQDIFILEDIIDFEEEDGE